MKRALTGFCLLVLISSLSTLHGQYNEPSITFNKLNHNFGTIKEADGTVDYRFEFTNNGSKPLVLHKVSSNCGCAVTEWDQEPIPPGGKGSILVTYNPERRPGAFRKVITVESNAREKTQKLYIVGLVTPRPKSIADEYPLRIGQIRFNTNHLSMTLLHSNEVGFDTIRMINMSESPMTIRLLEPPEHITFRVIPEQLKPQEKGMIIARYDASMVDDWGFVIERVPMVFNDEEESMNYLAVSATIEEDFSHLTEEELARAPKSVFSEEVFNFGTIQEGEKVSHTFTLTNEGEEALVIRKISTECGCTVSQPERYTIPSGESTDILCTFDSTGKIDDQFYTVNVIMNDPSRPTYMLRIIGKVKSR